MISDNRLLIGPDAQMKNDVLVDIESWRVDEIDDTSIVMRIEINEKTSLKPEAVE